MDSDASDREAESFRRTRANQRNRLLLVLGSVNILTAPGMSSGSVLIPTNLLFI